MMRHEVQWLDRHVWEAIRGLLKAGLDDEARKAAADALGGRSPSPLLFPASGLSDDLGNLVFGQSSPIQERCSNSFDLAPVPLD